MSFSKNAKLQMIEEPMQNDCCCFAFLCGLFLSVGHVESVGQDKKLSILTDIQDLYDYVNKIIHTLYGEYAELEITDNYRINKTIYYKITFPSDLTDRIMLDCGFTCINEKNEVSFSPTIPNYMIIEDCCKKSFVKAAFLGCATTNILLSDQTNTRTSSGYHLEFSSKNHEFLTSIASVLAEFDIIAKLIERKNIFVLYVKEAVQICDILALVGAYDSVLELNNEIAVREVRNKVNRQTNCESGNIVKTVNASFRQMQAISLINEIMGIENLPQDLQVVALLRIANPEESLQELLELSKLDITKSGLNHRLKKLEKIAESLK